MVSWLSSEGEGLAASLTIWVEGSSLLIQECKLLGVVELTLPV